MGRINGLYEQPRQIIGQLGIYELVTIAREKDDSLCCGGGGGRIWVEEPLAHRPSVLKLSELKENQIDIIITSCPYCLSNFSNTAPAIHMGIEVKDLLELI